MYVLIGCTATDTPESLYSCTYHEAEGSLQVQHALGELPKVAYLVPDAKKNVVYAVGAEASQEGVAASYSFNPANGALSKISCRSTLGTNPNYASASLSGSLLFAVNFAGGSACVLPLGADGSVDYASQHIPYEGSGPVPVRQASPHPHSIVPDPSNRYVVVADMGTDLLHVYTLDEAAGQLREHSRTAAPAGSGPRHLLFHPERPLVYIINEINSTIGVFSFDAQAGTLTAKQAVPALPEDFDGTSKCADLQLSPCGTYLYGTNRGHDSIVVYRIGEDGLLTYVEHTPSQGRNPRSLAISPDGAYLLCANEGSNEIVTFRIDADSGKLSAPVKQAWAASPICIKFMV